MKLQIDSRKVKKGDIFFCLEGSAMDGHDFAQAAAENGASVIVHSHDIPFNENGGTIYIKVDDTLKALNMAADSYYGFPSKKLTMFGVTGTNGKSSISYMISEIYSKLVAPCGYMGTIGGKLAETLDANAPKKYAVNLTTPGVIDMHSTLSEMVKDGAKAASIEVSSHGLVQGRVDAVDFDYAIYTNLTREHLDYFHDMETYFEAKALFFKMLKPEAVAVINADDSYGARMAECCTGKVFTYGINNESCDYRAENIEYSFEGMEFDLTFRGQSYHCKTDMHVTYNLYNLLAVAATLHQAGLSQDSAGLSQDSKELPQDSKELPQGAAGLSQGAVCSQRESLKNALSMENILAQFKHVPTIPGRMTIIDKGQDYKVIVDYAHTDDSYEQLLRYVKEDMPGVNRIITVSGAPGKRDKENRRSYAKWMGRYCDYSILTEEDPRDEAPGDISREIASYLPDGYPYEIIDDREKAIRAAILMAEKNDVILILGKGAETYQDRAAGKEHWAGDDVVADRILSELNI